MSNPEDYVISLVNMQRVKIKLPRIQLQHFILTIHMHVHVCITEIMLAKHISVSGYLTHLMQQSFENLLIMNQTDNHPHHLCDISELGTCCTGYKSVYRCCTVIHLFQFEENGNKSNGDKRYKEPTSKYKPG